MSSKNQSVKLILCGDSAVGKSKLGERKIYPFLTKNLLIKLNLLILILKHEPEVAKRM